MTTATTEATVAEITLMLLAIPPTQRISAKFVAEKLAEQYVITHRPVAAQPM